jgi:hypothetical protein
MIVNNPDNAGLTPGPGISLAIFSNNFSALTAVSFATERLATAGAASELDGTGFEVGAATEVARLYAVNEAASVAEGSASGCFVRDGAEFGVLEGCCCCFPNFLNIEENFLGMMIQNRFELGTASGKSTRLQQQHQLVTHADLEFCITY